MNRRSILLLTAAGSLSIAAVALARRLTGDEGLKTGAFQPPRAAPDFVLGGSDGSTLTLERYRGKVVVLEFGFTSCAKICPFTLSHLAESLRELGPAAAEVQVIFVTVDPERDTRRRLHDYLRKFDPRILGATGTTGDLDATTAELKAVRDAYGVVAREANVEGRPDIHHTSAFFLIDRQGALRALVPFGTPVEHIVHDVELLLRA